MAVIDEPAAAVAASLCLIARDRDGVTTRHPRRCGWCDYPEADLRAMVDGFIAWADPDEKRRTYGRHAARVFAELSATQQAALVAEAQGFEPEPTTPATTSPADEPQEETVPWMS